jgi:hypothetical protein
VALAIVPTTFLNDKINPVYQLSKCLLYSLSWVDKLDKNKNKNNDSAFSDDWWYIINLKHKDFIKDGRGVQFKGFFVFLVINITVICLRYYSKREYAWMLAFNSFAGMFFGSGVLGNCLTCRVATLGVQIGFFKENCIACEARTALH